MFRKILQYLGRATRLKCPVCGTKPIFLPLSRVRSLHDWLTPLDGCPRCGYAYDREPGYFLMSVWAIGYGVAALIAIGIYVYLEIWHSDWSTLKTLLVVGLPLPFINLFFARHAKAYFLAVDHLVDPHQRDGEGGGDGGGGGGGSRSGPPPAPAPRGVPVRREAAEMAEVR